MNSLLVKMIVLGSLVLTPLASIWALNVLCHLDIPYRWDTYLAVIVLRGLLTPVHLTRGATA